MDRMQRFSSRELDKIHDASMQILNRTGIDFNDRTAAGLLKKNGIKTHGTRSFFTEKQILTALETVPSTFRIHARNPDKTIEVGRDRFVFLPTGGVPRVAGTDGTQRPATLADYEIACKLVHTSDQLDMGGYIMVQPNDIPADRSHLDMIQTYLTRCDKPLFGATGSGRAAMECIRMTSLFFGGLEKMKQTPAMLSVVNAASPLQYAEEQTQVIMVMSEYNQPFVIANMILAGASGPVSLPGLLALQNAEILAGITLSQLISPGTPVVYGSTSAPMDMKTMVSAVGASETVKIAGATIQLAQRYDLPSRCGGGLTDAHAPDGQAMAESSLMLSTVVRNGANVIYHSCGQMGSFISMSFEKWLMDEEICQTVRQMVEPIKISTDAIDTDLIHDIGIGGQYLGHPSTFQQFRSLSQPVLFNRKDYSKWRTAGANRIDEIAIRHLARRLEAYEKPSMDPEIEKELAAFVDHAKQRY